MDHMADWLDRDDLTEAEIREHMREEHWEPVEALAALPPERHETSLWSLEVTHGAIPRELGQRLTAASSVLEPVS
jgi:hypothetical protein